MTSIRKRVAMACAVALFLVMALASLRVVRREAHRRPAVCAAMDGPVGDLQEFGWDNGITHSSASWIQVLSDGVWKAQEADRVPIATAVRADLEGFDRLYRASPKSLRPALHRQRALALDAKSGFAQRGDAQVAADALRIARYGNAECGFA